MKKKSFASFTNNFWSFKKRIKKYSSMGQNLFFFIRNLRALHLLFAGTYIRIWGHLYSAGIAFQLYCALRFEKLKRFQKSRAIPWEFWDEVFSLSMPSVCLHLTTVWGKNIPAAAYNGASTVNYFIYFLIRPLFRGLDKNYQKLSLVFWRNWRKKIFWHFLTLKAFDIWFFFLSQCRRFQPFLYIRYNYKVTEICT